MSVKVRCSTAVLAVTLAGLMIGCQPTHKGSNQYEDKGIKGSVRVLHNDLVILDMPEVQVSYGTIYIYGTVHRRPDVHGELPGRVDIEFLTPEGEYLDGVPALLSPHAVPLDPKATASYSTSYGSVPPPGSIIQVHFVDRQTQMEEDLQGNDFQYNHNAAKTGSGDSTTAPATKGSGTTSHW